MLLNSPNSPKVESGRSIYTCDFFKHMSCCIIGQQTNVDWTCVVLVSLVSNETNTDVRMCDSLGYPPLSRLVAWQRSSSRTGLNTDVAHRPTHFFALQMVAPRAAIYTYLAMGRWRLSGCCTCVPYPNFL